MSILRSGLAAAAGAVFILAGCGGPTPPNPSESPVPSSSPAVSGDPSVAPPTPDGSPGSDLLPPERQPALAGLYVPAGFLVQGSDHFALIQGPFDCPTMTDVLGAGQWTLTGRASIPIPTAAPGQTPQPMPDLNLPEWLLLRWGADAAVARIGGDENGCLAQVWRLPTVDYAAHGAIESEGEARELQLQCVAGSGQAQIGALFFGADGTFFSLQTTVVLVIGSQPVAVETELAGGQTQEVTLERVFGMFFGGLEGNEPDIPGIGPFFPAHPETAMWQGAVEITSIEPLVGEITLEDLRNETGEPLTLTTEFRCDLRPGQLTRAAEEAANATPSPVPTASPAPGQITVAIESGAHAGTHKAVSSDATCSLSLFGEGGWLASYSALEPTQGELQSLLLSAPVSGGKSDVTMFFGDSFEDDWFNTSDATTDVADNGSSVEFTVSGHAAGTDFTINFVCNDVARF